MSYVSTLYVQTLFQHIEDYIYLNNFWFSIKFKHSDLKIPNKSS